MKAPYRGWLGRAADELGLKYYWDESNVSSSRYFVVWWEPDDEDERFQDDFSSPPTFALTFRVSDHALPPTYVQRDALAGREVFEVGSHLEADGDMKDAVEYLKRWFDPKRIRRKLDEWTVERQQWLDGREARAREAEAIFERAMAFEARVQADIDRCLEAAPADLRSRYDRVMAGERISKDDWKSLKREIFGRLGRSFNDASSRFIWKRGVVRMVAR